jgi:hypothetical protein
MNDMSDLLGWLQGKYPKHKIKYSPKPDCKHCKGTGERQVVAGTTLCMCTCVDHKIAEIAMDTLSDTVKKLQGKI